MSEINLTYYNKALKKSVGSNKRVKYKITRKGKMIMKVLTIFLASIATISMYIQVFSDIKDKIDTRNLVEEGRQIVYDNTKRTDKNEGYYHKTMDIGQKLAENPDNFDKNLYGVYLVIGYNEASQLAEMNKVVAEVGKIVANNPNIGIAYYEDFTDYLIKNGFVKEDGTIDLKVYEKALEQQILKEAEEMKKR